jgi:SAM-dependent methyltransferase
VKDFWDKRYNEEGLAYGNLPNDFLKENFQLIPAGGSILCLAEGEGRNAIFLAQKNYEVSSVDFSATGIKKTIQRAGEAGVKIKTHLEDLNEFEMGINNWDAIISIFGHLPPEIRTSVHAKIIRALKPGGLFLMEAYVPEQLMFNSGGPKEISMMMSLEILEKELGALKPIIKRTCIRDIQEGKYHQGLSAVVQFVGKKI